MKTFRKIKTLLLILLVVFIFSPSFSLADPTGTCTYTATGTSATGYTQAQCPAPPAGSWVPDQTQANDPTGTCTLITGSTASGYTQSGCTAASGTNWTPDTSQTPTNPPPSQTCLPTGRPDIPYTVDGGESSTPCVPSNISPTADPNNPNPASTASSSATPNGGLVPPCSPNCGFNDFMTLINKVVHFILFAMAVPIAAIMFAYAGFLLVTSAGSTEQRGKAKRIFTNVAIGLILAVAAWLIIELILKLVGFSGSWIGF